MLATYWLSPIVVLATYWLGLNDLIPVTLLCLGLYYTRKLQLMRAGMLCGAAISAKLARSWYGPFFLIYLIRNRAVHRLLLAYLKGLGVAIVILILPFAFSSGLNMLVTIQS